jgi:Mn-dependent DtxR family transcriptional regulator
MDKGGAAVKIQESAEDYLETILMLSQCGEPVRSIDIVNKLEYTKPSVSIAMKKLRDNGHITVDGDGYITLTDSGCDIAKTMYERHMLISDWLIFMGVDKETAVSDACKIEHNVSEQSFLAIKKHFQDWKRGIYMQNTEKL